MLSIEFGVGGLALGKGKTNRLGVGAVSRFAPVFMQRRRRRRQVKNFHMQPA